VAELRRNGMKFGLFIHDLIQIRNKDYVMPDAVDRFNIQLSDALELCDFVLTNSAYVRDDVKLYLEQTKHLNIPVKEVLLPTELNIVELQNSAAELSDPKLNFVIENDYVLVVSTIEIRKNHKLLIQVWEELRKEMGDKVPYLVFVGKWGWQIDTLHAYIDNQGYEDDWLFIFNGISDVKMETLYKRAMFTVYPSFAEGFGLPIGESLAYGKPCLASNTTAMPEVGREFVRYFDPFDWQTALDAIRRPIVDRADLQAWQDSIANSFKPKAGATFATNFTNRRLNVPWPLRMIPTMLSRFSPLARSSPAAITISSSRQPKIAPSSHSARPVHATGTVVNTGECGLLTVAPKLRSEPICRKVRRPRSSCACTAPARVIQTHARLSMAAQD
jgi:glycosyltransferase involved in cell wall biosynthesis